MVYKAKQGTTSVVVFLLSWLINGLVPMTLTAGVGAKDPEASTPWSELSSRNETTGRAFPHTLYNCPPTCQCEYSSSSQKLEISCSQASHGRSEVAIDLTPGVRVLRISQTLLDSKSVTSVLPALARNTLVQLDLDQITIEPQSFFNTHLFRESGQSLRKLSISGASLRGDFSDVHPSSFRALLQPFASLSSMDSLIVCDSSPSLATVVLQAMPVVTHLQAMNNSLYEIPVESLSHQYSIQSVDFSKNHIAIIPNGLLQRLSDLVTLDVSHNRIFHLQEQVFTGLVSLKKLDVSFNKIEYVDAEVFTPLTTIVSVDLSHNEVVQFFEPYFGNNKNLQILNMSNMWVGGTFTNADTAHRSLMETEQLISTLHQVEKLDISANGMRTIPETLTHAPKLALVHLDGNQWECTCQDRWFADWVATAKVSIGLLNTTENMWCYSHSHGDIHRSAFQPYLKNLTGSCSSSNIIARTPCKFHAVMGKNKQLNCHAQKPNWPKITWITPSKLTISTDSPALDNDGLEPRVTSDGTLHLTNVTGVDYGLYLCIASYEDLNITHYVHLGVDVSVFRDVRFMSIVIGWVFSFSFLVLVLIAQLVRFILDKLGVQCFTMNTNRQTRRVRAFFDSMEQNKNSQLDWLRDNYQMQAKKIKDNCYSQLERIRESYSTQTKNLGEIRDYGTQQLHTLRDQYTDQVRRVTSYSAHQLCKVRENYVFKRNQVCKFSSHQLLRLRETYKWQAQTLNKILENLPRGLNFDTCRGMGACGRTDSIYLDDMGEFGSTQAIVADVYNLHRRVSRGNDKMEHVSLLIPPEFVIDYRQILENVPSERVVDYPQLESDSPQPERVQVAVEREPLESDTEIIADSEAQADVAAEGEVEAAPEKIEEEIIVAISEPSPEEPSTSAAASKSAPDETLSSTDSPTTSTENSTEDV